MRKKKRKKIRVKKWRGVKKNGMMNIFTTRQEMSVFFFCAANKNSVLHYMAVSYDFRDLDQQFTVVYTKREVRIKIHISYHHRRSRQQNVCDSYLIP